jgi:hypothetical protein
MPGRNLVDIPHDTFYNVKALNRIDLVTGYRKYPRRGSVIYQRWKRCAMEPVEVDESEGVWWRELGVEAM